MDKQKQVEEMAKRLPTIEEIEKEYKEWAVGLLKVRFDLKPEAFDKHHKNNYSFENCADCLWNKIKGSIEELLWIRENQIPENAVVLTREEYEKLKKFECRVQSGVCMTQKEWFDFCNEDSNRRTCLRIEEREKERKETAEKFAERAKEEAFTVFFGEPIIRGSKIDEICKEIVEGVENVSR